MRKRNISFLFDHVMWYLLYLLPVFMLVVLTCVLRQAVSFESVFELVGLNIATNSVVYTTLVSICGSVGVLPLFGSLDILIYLTYFVNVFIVHLLVDFVLFIPRLAHKWMSKFGGDD